MMWILIKCLIISFIFSSICLAESLVFADLNLEQAAQKILQETGNKLLNVSIDEYQGERIYLIKVLTPNGRVQYLKIRADTGEQIKE